MREGWASRESKGKVRKGRTDRKTIGKPSDGAGNRGFQVAISVNRGTIKRGTEKEKAKRSVQKKQEQIPCKAVTHASPLVCNHAHACLRWSAIRAAPPLRWSASPVCLHCSATRTSPPISAHL
jgi:hypothetical protein